MQAAWWPLVYDTTGDLLTFEAKAGCTAASGADAAVIPIC